MIPCLKNKNTEEIKNIQTISGEAYRDAAVLRGAVRGTPSPTTAGLLKFSEGYLDILFLSAVVRLIPFSPPVKRFRDCPSSRSAYNRSLLLTRRSPVPHENSNSIYQGEVLKGFQSD